jgi:hypothetical protein
MFNPLNRDLGHIKDYSKREGLHGYETHYTKDNIKKILSFLKIYDNNIDENNLTEKNLKNIDWNKIENKMKKDGGNVVEVNDIINDAKNMLNDSPKLKENMIKNKSIVKKFTNAIVLPKNQTKIHNEILNKPKETKYKNYIKR